MLPDIVVWQVALFFLSVWLFLLSVISVARVPTVCLHVLIYLYCCVDQGISFVALDACLEPGPKRPFNFFGVVRERDTEHLRTLIRAVEAGSSHSVWFGHYPTSCILSAGQGVSSTRRVHTLPG